MTKIELHSIVEELPEASWDAAAEPLRRAHDRVVAKPDAAPYDLEEKLYSPRFGCGRGILKVDLPTTGAHRIIRLG